jgi:hypothetical protein
LQHIFRVHGSAPNSNQADSIELGEGSLTAPLEASGALLRARQKRKRQTKELPTLPSDGDSIVEERAADRRKIARLEQELEEQKSMVKSLMKMLESQILER